MPSVPGAWANPDTKDLVHQNHRHTVCELWSEKTTVCRIFSCQRAHGDYVPKPVADARLVPRAKVGGEYRARTGDLLVANQALSQLS